MFNEPPRESEWTSWLYVAVWSLAIFITIPFARTIQETVYILWGREVFLYAVVMALLFVVTVAMLRLRRVRRRVIVSGYLWLGMIAALTIYSASHMNISPEEAVHFLEYGALGVLVFRALSHRFRDLGVYALAVLIGTLIGAADEIVQWIVPRRFFAFADIRLNAYAVVLAQAALALGIRPPYIERRVGRSSIRAICSMAMVLVLVLALCASNTPRVLNWMTRYPALAFLNETAGVMTEYGYRYDDPRIGTFFSRLPPARLREQDTRRCVEAAAILDGYTQPDEVEVFLRRYTPNGDPFLHEARVHIFRRDRYLAEAQKIDNDSEKRRFLETVAFRENQILELYFHETFSRSTFVWKPEEAAAVEKEMDSALPYQSAVSSGLLTQFTERQMWGAAILACIVLASIRRYDGSRKKT